MGFYRKLCKRVTWFSLATAAILTLVALRSPESHTETQPIKLSPATVNCEEIARIGRWSEDKYGGTRRDSVDSDKFRDRTFDLYLEKLDPHKILLTQSDVARFEKQGRAAWPAFIGENKCAFFQNWASDSLPTLQKRLQANLKALPVETLFPVQPMAEASDEEIRFPNFKQYVKDDAELALRLKKLVQKVASSVTASHIASYDGDKRKLMEDYVEQIAFGDSSISPKLLLVKAYLGAIDPYSTYFSAGEFEDFYHDLSGGTSGVGVKVRRVPFGLLIERIVKDSPAQVCHALNVGDVILNIDGIKLANLPSVAAKHLLKGAENTAVEMKVRAGTKGPIRTVSLKRKHFSFEDARVSYKLIDSKDLSGIPAFAGVKRMQGTIAVIEIPSFYGRGGMSVLQEERSSAEDLKLVVEKLVSSKNKLSAIVLDLRGNPGGFLEEAVSMAGLFIGDRPVVAVLENHHRRVLRDSLAKAIYTGPLVVLADGQSASASEVLAGALKDHQRALVVGSEHTYGKGSVQKLYHLEDELFQMGSLATPGGASGGVVKITTSIFYSPLGHSPANGGVKSDIALPEKIAGEEEDAAAPAKYASVTDQPPFIDEASLKEIEKKQRKMQFRLSALEKRSEERTKDIQALIDTTFKKALGIKNKPEPEEYGLAEAVAIASDYVQMESPLLSEKNDGAKPSSPSVASPRMGE